jgi:single-stranded-DNA-specific exonuclease
MTDSYGEGEKIARELEELNRERQRIQREIMDAARLKIEEELRQDDYVIVLAAENWPPGIIGIVASHIVEEYYRPTVMLSLEGDLARGSARSIPGLNMVEALTACRSRLTSFGGHAQAAGMRLTRQNLDDFRKELNAYAKTRIAAADFKPKLAVDGEVLLDSLNKGFVAELGRLSPFGQSAPEPVLVARNVSLAGRPRRVGASGKHLAFYLTQGGSAFRAIGFGLGEFAGKLPTDGTFHVAFTPVLDTYTGRGDVELRVKDIDVGEGVGP